MIWIRLTAAVLLAMLSVPICIASERLSVVVNEMDANGVSKRVARVVTDHLRVKLIESKRFVIPEREKMEAILSEQATGVRLGECLSQECALELGRLMHANKMIVGTVSQLNETYSISVRFLDLESGTAEFSAEEKSHSEDDLFLAAERLSARIVAFVPPRGKITAISGETAIINIGTKDGVTPGMEFRVLRKVERVKGYAEESEVATVTAVTVQPAWSRVQLKDGGSLRDRLKGSVPITLNDVVVGPQTITVKEMPRFGFLMVYSRPVGAEVYVDDKFHGRTTRDAIEVRVSAGKHTIRVTAPAHETVEQTVDVTAYRRVPFNATLEPKVPKRAFLMPITTLSYVRPKPTNETFRAQLDGNSMRGAQIAMGRVYSGFLTEVGAEWTFSNTLPGEGYGVNEIHRLSGFGHAGIAPRIGAIIPYIAVGYEFSELKINDDNVFDGSSIGSSGTIAQNGWYWQTGMYIRRWLHVGYRKTWGRHGTDYGTFTLGLNLSGF
jgi:hypothetical protein